MALPESVTRATVLVGTAVDFAGNNAKITAKVTPVLGGNAVRIVHIPTGTPVFAFTNEYTGSGSPATFTVPHVDQLGFVDGSGNQVTMWAYKVEVTVDAGSRRISYVQTFQPLVGQDSIDLDLVPDGSITAPLSAPIPAVTSVNGQTGAVTVTGGVGGPTTWDQVGSKPSTFPTTWDQVGSKPSTFATTWDQVGDKPSTFAPATHSHPAPTISGVEGLVDALATKLTAVLNTPMRIRGIYAPGQMPVSAAEGDIWVEVDLS